VTCPELQGNSATGRETVLLAGNQCYWQCRPCAAGNDAAQRSRATAPTVIAGSVGTGGRKKIREGGATSCSATGIFFVYYGRLSSDSNLSK
jgi:hypothetical protein